MAPDYKQNDPRGWGGDPRRGAAMGRATLQGEDDGSRLHLVRKYLNAGGYDSNGTYFGHGGPLYWCASESGNVDFMLRAATREAAKEQVRKTYPAAVFFR
jgi:hypothetical protein